MKYSEIIDVEKHFQSAYDILSDSGNAWKTFITNERFESNLSSIIKSFVTSKQENRKSIWIQGTYGTGKSHSLAVIKHLLSDDYSEIEDYLSRINSSQLRSSIANFRREKKVFCVVLKGVNAITDVADLKYTIQKEVISALGSTKVTTKTDFQVLGQILESGKFDSFFESIMRDNTELRSYAPNKQALMNAVKNNDIKVMRIISDEMKKEGFGDFRANNIVDWLTDVKKELSNQGLADYLLIIWDEFTTLLDIPNRRSILNVMQDIAELSYSVKEGETDTQGIYLLLVTHRKLEATDTYKELKEDEKTMAQARFVQLDYGMQPTTIYHIMSGALEVKKPDVLARLVQDNYTGVASVNNLLDLVIDSDAPNAREIRQKIVSLYPFHPYTAYLATFVSRVVGEAERSVFGFLNDEENGFKKYIQNDTSKTRFLTADYVWDFFYKTFEQNGNGHFDAITNKYKLSSESVEKKGLEYLAVFKTILLLNILYRVTTTDADTSEKTLVNPSTENIIRAYSGVYDENRINEILNYIDDNQIMHRNPDGVFEVASSSLPQKKILEEKKKLYSQKEDVAKIVEEYNITTINSLKTTLNSGVTRLVDVQAFWGGDKDHLLRQKLQSKFKTTYSLNIALVLFRGNTPELETLLGRKETSVITAKQNFITLSKEDDHKNIVFVIVNTELGNKRFEAYLDSVAQETVARTLQMSEEVTAAQGNAEKWIKNWIDEIKLSGYVDIVFRGDSIHLPFNQVSKQLKSTYIKSIFRLGLDDIVVPATVWVKQNSKKAVEIVLFSQSKSELESSGSGADAYVKNLLTYNSTMLFNEKLELISEDENIPIVKVCKEVARVIDRRQNEPIINLAEELKFLTKPEYGYYANRLYMGALGLALRPYVDKLYSTAKTTLVTNTLMKDLVVAIFLSWESGRDDSDKYLVRASSAEERELNEMLKTIFDLPEDSEKGLARTKWDIRSKLEENNNAPLWALKYVGDNNDKYKEFIDNMFKFSKTTEENIDQEFIVSLLGGVKNYQIELIQALSEIKNEHCLDYYIKTKLDEIQEDYSLIDSVIAYLKGKLSGNICYWEEPDVNTQIYLWKIDKDKKPEKEEDEREQTDSELSDPEAVNKNDDVVKELRESVLAKIDASKDDSEKLFTVLQLLVEKYSNILKDIDNLL